MDAASELKRRLAENAEAVCRKYLSNGRRQGRYWLVGDLDNSPGRSLYVRLRGPDADRVGRWTDAATGEHGDLLDLIAARERLQSFPDILTEARRFLSIPEPEIRPEPDQRPPAPAGSTEAARRLWAASGPLTGSLAAAYLRSRRLGAVRDLRPLRFHRRCYYRTEHKESAARDAWPALIAAVTDLRGRITGVHRTWLDPSGRGKAPVATPRRAMGELVGHAVRFGTVSDILAAGEGIETVLSVRVVLPTMPLAAALSAAHLAALELPPGLRRLYLVQDNDAAGRHATFRLAQRAQATGVDALTLTPTLGDFNDDLQKLGPDALAAGLRAQLAPEDVVRFWRPAKAA